MALEIFNCEINPLLEKFFEAPEPVTPNTEDAKADNSDVKENEIDDDEDGLFSSLPTNDVNADDDTV